MFKKIKEFATNCRGFTLTELLVVIAIIGLLAGITTVSMSSAKKQARDSKRKADLEIIAGALEIYYAQNREYPASLDALAPNYINSIPEDPSSDKDNYKYNYCNPVDGSNKLFILYAKLEKKETTELRFGTHCDNVTTGTTYYEDPGSNPYYRVTSP